MKLLHRLDVCKENFVYEYISPLRIKAPFGGFWILTLRADLNYGVRIKKKKKGERKKRLHKRKPSYASTDVLVFVLENAPHYQ